MPTNCVRTEFIYTTGQQQLIAEAPVTVNYAEAVEMLGKDNVLEACRFFANRNLHAMPDVTVENATKDIIDHAETIHTENF